MSFLAGFSAVLTGWPTAPSAVYVRHHAQAAVTIRSVIEQMEEVEEHFAKYPNDIEGFEVRAASVGRLMREADAAIVRFRNTRDCRGAG